MGGGSEPRVEQLITRDGLRLVYDVVGEGPTVLLHHGFAADARINWGQPGIVAALAARGRRVVALDARGHGRSDRPHDPAAYAGATMMEDCRELMDQLEVDALDVVGYSMGGRVAALLAAREPRVRSVVLGGVSLRLLHRRRAPQDAPGATPFTGIADALEAEDPAGITDPVARGFRTFAERTGADRLALAAIQRAEPPPAVELGAISCPVLVLAGDRDELVGDPSELARAIPGAELVVVHGDHLGAVLDPAFTQAIISFLDRCSPVAS
jgi:pimeloyl-ACP methyl ester carboxylesterase